MTNASLLILIGVFLPPPTLDIFGELVEERAVPTPFGEVGPIALRSTENSPAVWIQPYTGSSVRTDPRATVHAAHLLGVRQILNWDTGVALNPALERGQLAIVTDYIDWTRRQPNTFAGTGVPVPFNSSPAYRHSFCPHLIDALRQAFPGTVDALYLGVDGLRRETVGEANMFRTWGADMLGHNLVPEVGLAREVGLCYAGLVTVADRSMALPVLDPHGEVRASLGIAVASLPTFVRLASQPTACKCGETRG